MDLYDIVGGRIKIQYLIGKQPNLGQDSVRALVIFSLVLVSNILSAESRLDLH